MGLLAKIMSGLGLDFLIESTPLPEPPIPLKSSTISDFSKPQVLTELLTIYFEVSNNYSRFYQELKRIRETYIAEVIIEQLTYDTLTPEVSSDRILEIAPNTSDPEIVKAIQEFEERLNIDQLILDITPDLITYGSYTIRPVVEEGEGIVEIVDDLTPGEVLPFYKNSDIQFYLRVDPETNKATIHEPHEFVTFFINAKRIRLKLSQYLLRFLQSTRSEDFPRFVKVGSPLFTPGIIKKIKELDLLEKLVPASKIQALSKGNVVGVYVPPTMSPEEAFQFARELERKLNSLGIGVNKELDQLSITEILRGAGRTKVIPVTSEKGQVTKLDYKSEEPSDLLNYIQDARNVVLTSVGIPPEIIFNTGQNTKGEILKRYSRYLRKLKYTQKAITNGVSELLLIHLVNKGLSITPNDFTVRFKNSLTTVEHLDNLEVTQATVQILSDIKQFIDGIAQDEHLQQYISYDNFAEYLNKELTKIGLDAVIVLPGESEDLLEEVSNVTPTT